ncbi:MAG: RdgB/HAM1 family non-canonical purine NTP pyrophosphatase [Rickettsiales bacterium]|jgi:XTP/dITP diphosphohydrolase|nr:RdgB/HAM1 family non-canonical purine NTP pyrophosphatase [Rickettsiales bacterium]
MRIFFPYKLQGALIMKTIILASNNKNKIKEIGELLGTFSMEVKSLRELGLGDPEENGKTFEENALIKARYAFEKTKMPSLADDSGFSIDSLNGFPGLCSARFADSVGGHENAMKILNNCINRDDRGAYFITVLAFVYEKNGQVLEKTFEGKIKGQFTFPTRGTNGFGYCPCFTPIGHDKTFAEMDNFFRCKINHRAIALEKFCNFLREF